MKTLNIHTRNMSEQPATFPGRFTLVDEGDIELYDVLAKTEQDLIDSITFAEWYDKERGTVNFIVK